MCNAREKNITIKLNLSTQNTPIGHPKLANVLDPVIELYEDVKRKCLMRLEYENQMKSEALTSPSSKFYQKPLEYAMWKYAYYVCHKCKKVSENPKRMCVYFVVMAEFNL